MATLSTPLPLRSYTLRNRIVMPPMANNLCDDEGGVSDRLVEHYRRHAAGGSGMIIVEHAYVTPRGRVDPHQLGIARDEHVAGLTRIAAAIHEGNAVAIAQITHGGARCPSSATGAEPLGPSNIRVPGDAEDPRPMTPAEIQEIPGLFAAAARRALAAGFDGVEVHGAHGYLLNEFTSPFTNRRNDAYGDNVDGRLRLPLETLRAVREALGPSALLLYRFGADDGVDGGLTPHEAARFAPQLVEAGVDLLDVSGGLCGSRPADRAGQGFFVEAASIVRRAVTVPVAGVGGITDPLIADRMIREGLVDLVCVGRAQLKDSAWPRKALEALR